MAGDSEVQPLELSALSPVEVELAHQLTGVRAKHRELLPEAAVGDKHVPAVGGQGHVDRKAAYVHRPPDRCDVLAGGQGSVRHLSPIPDRGRDTDRKRQQKSGEESPYQHRRSAYVVVGLGCFGSARLRLRSRRASSRRNKAQLKLRTPKVN